MDYLPIIPALSAVICVALVYYFWIKQPSERQLFALLQELMQFRAIIAQSGKTIPFDILQAALEITITPSENPVTKLREKLLNSGIQLDALTGHNKLLLDEVVMSLDNRKYRRIVSESKRLLEAYRQGYREAKRLVYGSK